MSTYATLRDRALAQVSATGQSEAQAIAQTALEEAMKFVAFHVRVPSLIGSATATAGTSPELESNAIALTGSGFSITAADLQSPDRLYVAKDSTIVEKGTPYEYMEYHHFLDLKAIPSATRIGVTATLGWDERPDFCYTITPSNKIWANPLTVGNVLTFYYRKPPAAYSALVAPEIMPLFDYILVNGAVVALKEYLREPAEIIHYWDLFETHLMKDVERYDLHLSSGRHRSHMKIHRTYRIY